MGKSTVRYAVLDGFVRAFALFLAVDLLTSVYAEERIALYFGIAAVAVLVLPFLLGALSFKKSQRQLPIGKYTLLSGGVYIVSAVIFPLINGLTVNIHLLPMRELSNADGLLILAVLGASLVLNLIGRAAVLAVIWSKQKASA